MTLTWPQLKKGQTVCAVPPTRRSQEAVVAMAVGRHRKDMSSWGSAQKVHHWQARKKHVALSIHQAGFGFEFLNFAVAASLNDADDQVDMEYRYSIMIFSMWQ
ncbi:hypothetical protein GUJ93_ZPchr0006g44703 [Zizania palustris]|uniref:Uncharacterized protein n=1 Tax=Zizania palustris TaxID=103762 RepID=A0A8J5T852_ZIZPA|nr:hypothetical protein GUJ93_ZPchr0006g44703 [Zizania palustris]